MKRRKLILAVVASVLWGLAITFWQISQFNDGKLHLVFCDVGQGDATYLKSPSGTEVLIDGGPDDKVLDCLSRNRPFYDRKIEILVLTHPQADHLTGLIYVLQRYEVEYLVIENIFNSSAVFAKFREAVVQEDVQIYNPKAGDRFRLGELEFNFHWPREVIGDKRLWVKKEKDPDVQISAASTVVGDPNDYSLVFDIKYKNFVALQTGDAESQILEKALNESLKLTVLKVPHHGSKKALSEEILQLLSPQLALISVGEKNRFGHPAKETLDLLKRVNTTILRTDEEGEVKIIFDGEKITIE